MIEKNLKAESKKNSSVLAMILLIHKSHDKLERLPQSLRKYLPALEETYGKFFRNNNRQSVQMFFTHPFTRTLWPLYSKIHSGQEVSGFAKYMMNNVQGRIEVEAIIMQTLCDYGLI